MTEPKKYLFVINDAPYGNEHPYSAMRRAMNLSRQEEVQVQIFLVAEAVNCTRKGQNTPEGYYNIERMIRSLAKRGKVAT